MPRSSCYTPVYPSILIPDRIFLRKILLDPSPSRPKRRARDLRSGIDPRRSGAVSTELNLIKMRAPSIAKPMGRAKASFVLLDLLQQELGLIYARKLFSGSQQLFKLFASLNIIA